MKCNYFFIGQKGVYTRQKGLDKDTNKALLEKHIRENKKEDSKLQELLQLLPHLSRNQVQFLLAELKEEGKVQSIGKTNVSKWYPV